MIYTLKTNHHYADKRPFIPYFKKELRFVVRFDDSAFYPPVITDYDHSTDINKLYGFREGFSDANSARIGWNCMNEKLYLFPYAHVEGIIYNKTRIWENPLCEVKPYEDVDCRIKCMGGDYLFQAKNYQTTTPRGNGSWLKFICHPYHGGPLPAHHDTRIKIVRY